MMTMIYCLWLVDVCKMVVFPGRCAMMTTIQMTFHWMMNDRNFGDTLHDDVLSIRGVYVEVRDAMAMTYLDKLSQDVR